MNSRQEIRPNWNDASRSVVTGLHLLQLSTRRDWIVRHELTIDLISSNYAEQRYEVDVDMSTLIEQVPRKLLERRQQRVWVPILRIPSTQASEQRIRAAFGSDGQVMPVMPQAEIRRYLATALTWLILNDAPRDIQQLSSARHALLRNEIRRSMAAYIRSGDRELIDSLETRTALPSQLWTNLKGMVDARSGSNTIDYRSGVAECIAYCRLGFFIVVGIDRGETAPHIKCELLPPELRVDRYRGIADAHELLGFRAGTKRRMPAARHVLHLPRTALSALTVPSRYHLRIPVPEIADLGGAHVQVNTPEDVCAEPAVLHHDQRQTAEGDRLVLQSRCRGSRVTPSPLEVLETHLTGHRQPITTPGAGDLLAEELHAIASEWSFRAARLESVERHSDAVAGTTWLRRRWARVRTLLAPIARRLRRDQGRWPVEPSAQTVLRQGALNLAGLTHKLGDEIKAMATVLRQAENEVENKVENGAENEGEHKAENDETQAAVDRARSELRSHTVEGIGILTAIERSIPHVEMTSDDDRREHVAHFHVDSTRTVHQRTTDSRPVINAIVRPSRQGRNDFVGTASLSCLTSTILLVGLYALVQYRSQRVPDSEALVALLLLVPGLSVSLLGRIPGETMRHLVLGRAQRLASLSLVPPVVSAAVIATLFGGTMGTEDQTGPVELPGFLPDLTVAGLLLTTSLFSLSITGLVVRDYLRGGRPFDYNAPVLGLITYRSEEEDEAGRTSINSDRIAELVEPSLFQIGRPSQRFMVWVVLNEDAPNVFRRVLDVLETLPRHLDGASIPLDPSGDGDGDPSGDGDETGLRPPPDPTRSRLTQLARRVVDTIQADPQTEAATDSELATDGVPPGPAPWDGRRDPTIIESSLVTSVATTGVAMSIVAHDLEGGRGWIQEEEIEDIVTGELEGLVADFHVVVQEIADDTRYFRYRVYDYEHFSFVGQNDKSRRHDLVKELLRVETPTRRISYLYCPIRAHPLTDPATGDTVGEEIEGDDAAVRVGFAVVRDVPEPGDHLRLRLTAAASAAGYRIRNDRSVADEDGCGLGYRWSGGHGRSPAMLVSAGPDNGNGLRRAFELLGQDEQASFEGGTVLTDGGYTMRALRFWTDEQRLEEMKDSVAPDHDRTHWKVEESGIEDPIAGTDSGTDPAWIISWIRWRLEIGPKGVAYLLSVLEQWADATGQQPTWSVTFTNIEFLANRLHDRRLVSGKARYRLGITLHRDDLDIATVADEVHLSLETTLRAGVDELLTSARRYIVVEGTEPRNPLTALADQP